MNSQAQPSRFRFSPDTNRASLLTVLLVVIGVLASCLLIVLADVPSFRMPTLLLAIASASFLFFKGQHPPDLLNPVRVLGALWCFCLALASMRLLPLISDWGALMWGFMITALVSFVVGYAIADKNLTPRLPAKRRLTATLAAGKDLLPSKRTLGFAALCVLCGTGVLAYEYSLIGAIPVFSQNVDETRMELFGVAGQGGNPAFDKLYIKILHLFVEFNRYGIFLAAILLFQRKQKSRKLVFLSIFLMLFGALAHGSQGGRTFVVDIVITSVVLFHYLRRRIRLMELVTAGLILFLFVGLVGSMRIARSESAPLFQRGLSESAFPGGAFWDGIAFGYATLTSPFEVFNRLTEDLQTTQIPPSGFTFYAFHRFLPRANIQEFAFDLYGGELVVATFLSEFYADFGFWGVLFGPMVFGLTYGWAYSRARGQNVLYWIYVRAVLLKMLIFFPYVNLFSQYVTWVVDLFFMYLLLRYVRARPARQESPAGAGL